MNFLWGWYPTLDTSAPPRSEYMKGWEKWRFNTATLQFATNIDSTVPFVHWNVDMSMLMSVLWLKGYYKISWREMPSILKIF